MPHQVSNKAIIRDMEPSELEALCIEIYLKCKARFSTLPIDEWNLFTLARTEYFVLTGQQPKLPRLG